MARGKASAHSQTRRPGNSYRTVIQARETPSSSVVKATPVASERVFQRSSGMRVDQRRLHTVGAAVSAT